MRKCKFITGTVSLTLAMTIGITSFAQISGNVGTEDVFVAEYATSTPEAVVEKSANEVNVLMDTGIKDVMNVSFEIETPASIIENITKKAEEKEIETVILKNNKTESESKDKETEKSDSKDTKKKNSKKKSKENKETKKSKNSKLKKMGTYKITAYCGCSKCCGKSNGITASGTKAKAGRTIAADTSVFPFGTKLVIDGKTYTVEDRGGRIKGNKIDLYFDSHSEALQWGVRYIDVYVQK